MCECLLHPTCATLIVPPIPRSTYMNKKMDIIKWKIIEIWTLGTKCYYKQIKNSHFLFIGRLEIHTKIVCDLTLKIFGYFRVIRVVTLPSPCLWACFHPVSPLFQCYLQSKEILLNLSMKCSNSAFNAQGSKLIIISVQVGAVKIYVAAVDALRKQEREDETQFTEKVVWVPVISLGSIFILNYMFDALLCQNWPFSPPNRLTLRTTLLLSLPFASIGV